MTVLQHSRSGRKGTSRDLSASSANSQIHCRTTEGRGLIVNIWRTWMLLVARTALFTHGCVRKLEFFSDPVSGTYSKHSLDTKKAAAITHLFKECKLHLNKISQYCCWTGLNPYHSPMTQLTKMRWHCASLEQRVRTDGHPTSLACLALR